MRPFNPKDPYSIAGDLSPVNSEFDRPPSKFKVEIERGKSEYSADFNLSITHNGYQWQSIGLSRTQAVKVIAALQTALTEGPHEPG